MEMLLGCHGDMMSMICKCKMSGRDKNATKGKGISHSRSLE